MIRSRGGVTTPEQRELRKRGLKRCTVCGQVKDLQFDFYHSKRQYPNGHVGVRVDSCCKPCRRRRTRTYMTSLDPDERAAKRAQWHAGMDQDKRRATERDYARMRALLSGQVQNPRGPYGPRKASRTLVDPALFLEWAHFMKPVYTAAEQRRINEATRTGRLSVYLIDEVMTRYGATDQFQVFYGDT